MEVRTRITIVRVPAQIGKTVLLCVGFKNTLLTADFVLAVADKLPTGINMNVRELNSLVIEALNDEFLRARLGGMYDTVEDCRDMFFRVSGGGFDWTAVIKRFVRENAVRIDNITVLWDYESTGRKDFFKDEKGRDINKIPISEFI